MFFSLLYALCLVSVSTVSSTVLRPPPSKFIKYAGQSIPGQYIVRLKADVTGDPASLFEGVTNTWTSSGINGFSGKFSASTLQTLLDSPEIEQVEEDGIVHIMSSPEASKTAALTPTQTDAPWGLSRLSQDAKLANQNTSAFFPYTSRPEGGSGTDIYVIDTGVYVAHTEFAGRARWGATFGNYLNADGNGHGTHCAGTAAGTRYGVAKQANVIAVKVLSDQGAGATSDIISGLNWIIKSTQSSGRPSVVLMALGGGISLALDNAVTAVTNAGIHVVVAAGNSGTDASNSSPGRVPSVITVGASTIADTVVSGSNYGSTIDLFAPGVNILSAWIGSPTATNVLSGSSMSAAHVAGLIAYLLSILGPSSAASMSATLAALSVKGALTGVRDGTLNNLASNNLTRLPSVL